MQPNQILQSSFLDVLFENRNKAYGAYPLRQYYNQRLASALALVMGLTFLLFLVFYVNGEGHKDHSLLPADDLRLVDYDPEKQIPPPPPLPPPPPMPPPSTVAMTAYLPPVIVPNEDLANTEAPEIDQLMHSRIGPVTAPGDADMGIVIPALAEPSGTGEAMAIKSQIPEDSVFIIVENPAEFPGGPAAWRRYLEANLRMPDAAADNGTHGTVNLQFVIDQEGNISEVVALNDPGDGLADEAVRIIRKGPKWRPAEQNNRKVKYRHIQRITFQHY